LLADFGRTGKEMLVNLFGDTESVDTIVSPSWFYENIGSVIDSQLLLSEIKQGTQGRSPTTMMQSIDALSEVEIRPGSESELELTSEKDMFSSVQSRTTKSEARLAKRKLSLQSKLMEVGNAGRSPPLRANRTPVALLTPSGLKC
jgi:hypothetical protein